MIQEKAQIHHAAYLESPKPHTWKQELQELTFNNPLLREFPDLMKRFLENEGQLIRPLLDKALALTYSAPYEAEAPELIRSLVLGCVLTQNRLDDENQPIDSPHRKYEKVMTDEGEKFLPSFVHPLRVYIKSLEMGVNSRVAKATPLHDVREDGKIQLGNTIVEKAGILDALRGEFADQERLMDVIEAVSKYDEIPPEIDRLIRKHPIYETAKKYVLQYLKAEGKKAEEFKNFDESIMKAISSVIKINATLFKYAGNEQEYLQLVAEAFTLKLIDIDDNLNSEGTKPPILLRDRLFATMARLMHSPLSDSILSKLASRYNHDPLFTGLDLKKLVDRITPEVAELYERQAQALLEKHAIKASKIIAGLRIPSPGEGSESTPAYQLMIRCSKDAIRQFREEMSKIEQDEALLEIMNSTNGTEHIQHAKLEEYTGILKRMIDVFGRDGMMVRAKNQDNNTQLYLRFIDDESADFSTYALHDYDGQEAPEAKFVRPVFHNQHDILKVLNSFLTGRLLVLDPTAIANDPTLAVFVHRNGFISGPKDTPLNEICAKLTLAEKCEAVGLMSGIPKDQMSEDEYPIYLLEELKLS